MRRLLLALAVGWLAWSALHPRAHAREETPTLQQLQSDLASTKARVARLEARVQALESGAGAEARAIPRRSTRYVLDRKHMVQHLFDQLVEQAKAADEFAGLSEDAIKGKLEKLYLSTRAQFQSLDLQVELFEDRSMEMRRRTKIGASTQRGIWSRVGAKLVLTITHASGKRLTPPELIHAKDLGDALELPDRTLTFIRLRKEP